MTNPYFASTGSPVSQSRGASNAIRAQFALVEAGFDKIPTTSQLWGATGNYAVAGGSPDVWTVSVAASYLTSYVDGMQVRVKFPATNATTTPTLNVNGLGAKTIVAEDGSAIEAGNIALNMIATVTYNSSSGKLHITDTATLAASTATAQAAIATTQAGIATSAAGTATTQATAAAASRTAIDDRIYPGTYNPAAAPTTKPISGNASADGDEFFGTDGYTYLRVSGVWVNQTVAAAASATAAATSATASATSATASAASAASAAASDASAATNATSAATSSATAGAYPNTAASNVPRGLTQASVGAITAGSGGTNGTFNLSWSGGNFSINPTGTFTVAGGVVTVVTITGPGLYIGASPTVPTPSFAASAGLTGAAVVLTAQFLVTSGQGYWVEAADGLTLLRYYNSSGTATADSGVGTVPNAALVTDIGNGPLRREDYGPVKRFPNASIVTGTLVTLDSTGTRFSIGATTGSLVMSTPNFIPVALGDTIVVWFEATIGLPTTATIRFYNVGSALDSALTMVREGGYYRLEATATNAATTAVRITINNTSGGAIEVVRPHLAFKKASAKDGIPDPNITALRNLAARSAADDAPNLWRTDSVGKVTGAGAAATINGDGTTVNCPPDAISFIRGDLVFTEGTAHAVVVKLDTANLNVRGVRINYNGSSSVLTQLDNYGGGLWGKLLTVPVGVGTSIYVRVEVDNSTNTQYTAAAATVQSIRLVAATQYPNQLPVANGGPYEKSEVVVQQTPTQVMVYKAGTKPGSSRYIGWSMDKYAPPTYAGGGAGWQLGRFIEAQRNNQDNFSFLGYIADQGYHQLAVREITPGVFMGSGHGYQINGELLSLGLCTISIASPGVVTLTAHGLLADTPVAFTTTGTLPTGLLPGVTYYVLAAGLAANTFRVGATVGGAAINTSGTQSGEIQLRRGVSTITIATPGVITLVAHGLAAGDQVCLTTTGALPTGLTVGTPYYVLAAGLTADAFEVSATSGGSAINTTGTQSGVHTLRKCTEALFIDGAKKSADTTVNYRCRQVRMLLHSTLFSTTTTGLALFLVTTEVTFDSVYVTLRNRLMCIAPAALTMSEMYLAMFSFSKQFNVSGAVQIDYVYEAPEYREKAVAAVGNSLTIQNTAERHLYTGSNGMSAEVEVLKGWDNAARESWIQGTGSTIKSYFSATGVNSTTGTGGATGYTVNPGDVFEMVTRYRLDTSN